MIDDEEPRSNDWRNDVKMKADPEDVAFGVTELKRINRGAVIAIAIALGVIVFGGIIYTIAHRSSPANAEQTSTGRVISKNVAHTPDSIRALGDDQRKVDDKLFASIAPPPAADALPMMHDVPPISAAYPSGEVEQGESFRPRNYHARTGKSDDTPEDSDELPDIEMPAPKQEKQETAQEELTPPSMPLGQAPQMPIGVGAGQLSKLADALADNNDDKQEAFMSRDGIGTLCSDEEDMAECEVSAGRPVVGNLLVATNSDVPSGNTVTFVVTKQVMCGADREFVAIPQGSTFVGEVNSRVGYGMERQQLCLHQLERPPSVAHPHGSRKDVGCFVAADLQGAAGVEADVDNHWAAVISGALLSAVLGVGASASMGNQEGFAPTIAQNAAHGAGNSINQAGQRIVSRELQRKPTLTTPILEGVTVMLTKNLQLDSWTPRKKAKHRRMSRW